MNWKRKSEGNWGRLGMKCKRYTLSELAIIKYGKNQKKVLLEDGNIPIYGTGGLMGYATAALYDKPSVLIGRKGTIGKVKYVEHPFWTVDTLFYTIINTDIVIPKYLYYVMSLIDLNNYNEGTTIPSLRTETLNRLEFNIPSMEEQEIVLSCLNPIDEKIELNNAINNNLAEQANALYQSFFSPKSDTQGKVVTLDEYCSIFTGKKNANASVEGGKYKFFTCAPDALQIDSYIYDGNVIIVSGNGAYTGRTRFYSGRFDLYQRTYACTLLDHVNPDYIFPLYWFVKLELSKKIMGGTRGSAIPYIVMNDLAKFEFVYDEKTFATYMPVFKSLTESIQVNEFENERLAEMRDALLPQLLSWQLDVSNIDD